ncbi:hypothetical protein JW879_00345 [candidate division WOR-3 bacterium]|nr:hypothetical protein [candidate division WOR-3 bacterium]
MRKNILLLEIIKLILLGGALGCPAMMVGPGQGMSPVMEDMARPSFVKSFSVVYQIVYNEESFPYIKIYYNIPYSGITFIKADSLYKASFRLNFNVLYEGETTLNKSITEDIKTKDYSKTVSSKDAFFGTFRESISTGSNEVSITVMDKNSDRRYVWKREILVPEILDTLRRD